MTAKKQNNESETAASEQELKTKEQKAGGSEQEIDQQPEDGVELSELEAARLEWEKEKTELLDKILRKQADIDNLRRISKMEQTEAREYALYDFMNRLLPVLDNIERALEAARAAAGLPETYLEGLEMIRKQLEQILTQEGVSVIEAAGTPFDPHCHHAVMEVESEDHDPGTVTEELQKGYRHRQRILRPSMVKVCRG
jgi:molecular chaperone GrpE